MGGKPSERFQVGQEASQLKPKGAKSPSAHVPLVVSAGTEAMRFRWSDGRDCLRGGQARTGSHHGALAREGQVFANVLAEICSVG